MITGKTKICGLIGDPVEHTVSPAMQNAAFLAAGLDFVYLPFMVKSEGLEQALEGMRGLNIAGLNVTIPHKVRIIPLLDEIDMLVENLGAVNTVVNEDGNLKGYNTDAAGFISSMTAEEINPQGKRIVVLGAGGAARAIAFILTDKGADVTIINRHLKPAQELAGHLAGRFRREITSLELNPGNLKTALDGADILVNTTAAGMSPNVEDTLVPARLLKKSLIVFDIIYNPLKTRLLKEAEKKGARVMSGLEMLVRQGAAAFELWTGQKAPLEVMREAAIRELTK
ncbi:MAG TPA: shikimate dehydrogenase [Dehalococcoidales bacterium]